jgi:branched-chain amino acid aminotransferase
MLFRRAFSTAPLESKRLAISRSQSPKELLPLNKLVFGQSFTDHMLMIQWSASKGILLSLIASGWEAPQIKPYQKLSLDPSATVFHYGVRDFLSF